MDEYEQAVKRLELLKKKKEERQAGLAKFNSMSLAQKLLLPENKFRLERLKQISYETFQIVIKKRNPLLANDWKGMCDDYWKRYLEEKVRSIDDYLEFNKDLIIKLEAEAEAAKERPEKPAVVNRQPGEAIPSIAKKPTP